MYKYHRSTEVHRLETHYRFLSQKTALEAINPAKTLTVHEALFGRECVLLSMHGCMESMTIKQHPFWTRPCTAAHFCGTSTHIGQFEEYRIRDWGHRGRTGSDVDLGATVTDSSN